MTHSYETPEGEHLLETLEEYGSMQEDVVDALRDYSESQQELWRQVPYRALKAQGWTGFSDKYAMAYRSGFWQLDASTKNGHYTVYVDLETGELVRAGSITTEATPLNEMEEEIVEIIEQGHDAMEWYRVWDEVEERYGREGKQAFREMMFRGDIDEGETGRDMLGEFSYEPAREEDILKLADSPEELNAELVLSELEAAADYEKPHSSMRRGLEELEEWHEEQAELYGVEERYSRD